jgi:alpha-beta hydrolase superfamily lysophospholipase
MLMIDKPVSIGDGDQALHGSLVVPEGSGQRDAVLIWSGSGPTDRDGNSKLGLNNNSLKMLAHALGEAGYISLRTDKRGIGDSAAAMKNEAELRLETYVDDAVLWARFLQEAPNVRKVFLLGHSEGGLIATLAAQSFKASGLILVAAVGFRATDVIRRQLSAPGITIPNELLDEIHAIMKSLESGMLVPQVPSELTAQYRPSVQPYLISWFKYDPVAELARTEVPVLVIQGSNDLQVSVQDADRLAGARNNISVLKINRMNHVLKVAPTDRADNFATYTKPLLPLAPELLPALIDFLKKFS